MKLLIHGYQTGIAWELNSWKYVFTETKSIVFLLFTYEK